MSRYKKTQERSPDTWWQSAGSVGDWFLRISLNPTRKKKKLFSIYQEWWFLPRKRLWIIAWRRVQYQATFGTFFSLWRKEELSLAVILLNREPYWGLPGPWLLWPCLKGPCTIIHLPSPTVYNKSLLEHCTGTSTTLLNMLYITLTY